MDQHVTVDDLTRLLVAIHIAARTAEENGDYVTASDLDNIGIDLTAGVTPVADLPRLHQTVGDP
jgi:hypothetical protein